MSENHVFYLSKVKGGVVTAPVAGSMSVSLSDIEITLPLDRNVKRELQPGMVVLCKCIQVPGGVKTQDIAIVDSFQPDGSTPDKIRIVYGNVFKLTGKEKIIDHRQGCHCNK